MLMSPTARFAVPSSKRVRTAVLAEPATPSSGTSVQRTISEAPAPVSATSSTLTVPPASGLRSFQKAAISGASSRNWAADSVCSVLEKPKVSRPLLWT